MFEIAFSWSLRFSVSVATPEFMVTVLIPSSELLTPPTLIVSLPAPVGPCAANVADLELDVAGEVLGTLAVRVDLLVEIVESAHVVALGKQPVGEVRADEPGAAGDQNAHGRA